FRQIALDQFKRSVTWRDPCRASHLLPSPMVIRGRHPARVFWKILAEKWIGEMHLDPAYALPVPLANLLFGGRRAPQKRSVDLNRLRIVRRKMLRILIANECQSRPPIGLMQCEEDLGL